MNTTMAETPRQGRARRPTPMDEARIGYLRRWLERYGSQALDERAYGIFRAHGFSRAELTRTIELMAGRGEAVVEVGDYEVVVRLAEGAERR